MTKTIIVHEPKTVGDRVELRGFPKNIRRLKEVMDDLDTLLKEISEGTIIEDMEIQRIHGEEKHIKARVTNVDGLCYDLYYRKKGNDLTLFRVGDEYVIGRGEEVSKALKI